MSVWNRNNPRTVRMGAARLIGTSLIMGLAAWSLSAVPQVTAPPKAKTNAAGLGVQVPLDSSTPISFAVVFNFNAAGLKSFVDQVSNPNSPLYRQFIGPDQIGLKFGASQADVDATVAFLQSKGFTITRVTKSHTAVFATGTAQQVQSAFQTSMVGVQRSDGSTFHTNLNPVTLPDNLVGKVHSIRGLDTSRRRQARTTTQLNPTLYRAAYNADIGYAGGYYGQGTNVAVVNEDGFRTNNLPLFFAEYGLPLPTGVQAYPLPAANAPLPWPTPTAAQMLTNVTVKPLNGGTGTHYPQGEGDLDQQNVLQSAPLCNLYIYDDNQLDNSAPLSIYAAISDDNIADIMTESYGWATYGYQLKFTWNQSTKTISNMAVTAGQFYGSEATEDYNERLVLAAQGVTQLAASGDSGTLSEVHPIVGTNIPASFITELTHELNNSASGNYSDTGYSTSYPDIDPEVLSVGGSEMTVATKNGGSRNGEASWGLSGGIGGTGGFDIYDTPAFDSSSGTNFEPYIGYDGTGNQFAFNVAPTYQKAYVPKYSGPYNYRLFPDVASASGGQDGLGNGSGATYPYPGWAYQIFLNRPPSGGNAAVPIGFQAIIDGTSCASPAIAGSLAVVWERLFMNTTPNSTRSNVRLGRIQDVLYGIAATNAFNDIHTGTTDGDIPGVILTSGATASIVQGGYGIAVHTVAPLNQLPVVGHSVTITGASPASLNGTYIVATVTSASVFNLQSLVSQNVTATTQGQAQLLLGAFPGTGWDFATGLGSMNFNNLYQMLLSMGK